MYCLCVSANNVPHQQESHIIGTRTKVCNARARLRAPHFVAVIERAHSIIEIPRLVSSASENRRGTLRTKMLTCSWFSAAKLDSNILLYRKGM